MIAIILSPLGRVLGVLAVAASLMGLSWLHGYQRGAASERTAILMRSVEVLRERNRVDEQARNMDSPELCGALGGKCLPEDNDCQ
ncbi:hypothetical protein MIC97_15880 [Aquamicrobium sp. NLF2-7]|uniref:hypothetical protein n=1 Tax=Aquamicrobium sp. NLF2-7 TaxID=2918753 RepID=UPI001EFA31BC|nr:hypothetical protein [Aquamicrobium sp. NLF2-7]MCG8272977.1 hypothetical protein [Aquamicrobium sp. NLF2-7]